MSIITFTSDFGWRDHYVATVKAKVLAFNQNIKVVDISHDIEPNNITQTAYILKNVFREFPEGTVHLVGVNSWEPQEDTKLIALRLEEHYFVGFDNGMFSLISNKKPMVICELTHEKSNIGTFPEKTIMANAAAKLSLGSSVYDLGRQLMGLKQLILSTPFKDGEAIVGQVIHIDNYGNIITNINTQDIEIDFSQKRTFVKFGRHEIQCMVDFTKVSHGDPFAFFNSNQNLCIGIKCGNATKLLGCRISQEVRMTFVS
jgi:S-adenosyl-L-methionine hydrolase (adenosine-forming)